MPYKWTKLFDLLIWLQNHPDYKFCFLNHEQALENALFSGQIPFRAKDRFKSEFARIESQLSNAGKISVYGNSAEIGFRKLEYVEADRNAVETWLIENAIDGGHALSHAGVHSPSKVAIDDLKRYLSTRPDNPPEIKREFFERLKGGNIPELGNRYRFLSKRAFDRAWTEAAPVAWTKGGFRRGRQRQIKSLR
jgi:hypothetical protein